MKTSAAIVLGGALVGCVLAGCGGDGGGGGGNDGAISFTAAVLRQNEDGSPGMDVTLERVGGSGAVGVTVTFTGGTATGGGVDYDSTPIVVSWAAGDLANKVVTVPLVDDNIDEQPAENIDMELTNPTGGATLGLSDAVLNINDDDIAGTVQFDMSAFNMSEGVAGGSVIVTRTGGLDGDISVTVASMDGTANSDPLSVVEPVDYQPISTIAFFADQSATPVIIPVMLIDDLLPELDETFTITLSNPTGGADIGAAASAYPSGWLGGVDMPISELLTEVSLGYPFVGEGGPFTLFFSNLPPLTFYAVVLHFFQSGTMNARSNAIDYSIP